MGVDFVTSRLRDLRQDGDPDVTQQDFWQWYNIRAQQHRENASSKLPHVTHNGDGHKGNGDININTVAETSDRPKTQDMTEQTSEQEDTTEPTRSQEDNTVRKPAPKRRAALKAPRKSARKPVPTIKAVEKLDKPKATKRPAPDDTASTEPAAQKTSKKTAPKEKGALKPARKNTVRTNKRETAVESPGSHVTIHHSSPPIDPARDTGVDDTGQGHMSASTGDERSHVIVDGASEGGGACRVVDFSPKPAAHHRPRAKSSFTSCRINRPFVTRKTLPQSAPWSTQPEDKHVAHTEIVQTHDFLQPSETRRQGITEIQSLPGLPLNKRKRHASTTVSVLSPNKTFQVKVRLLDDLDIMTVSSDCPGQDTPSQTYSCQTATHGATGSYHSSTKSVQCCNPTMQDSGAFSQNLMPKFTLCSSHATPNSATRAPLHLPSTALSHTGSGSNTAVLGSQEAKVIGPTPAAVDPRTDVRGPTTADVGPNSFCALGQQSATPSLTMPNSATKLSLAASRCAGSQTCEMIGSGSKPTCEVISCAVKPRFTMAKCTTNSSVADTHPDPSLAHSSFELPSLAASNDTCSSVAASTSAGSSIANSENTALVCRALTIAAPVNQAIVLATRANPAISLTIPIKKAPLSQAIAIAARATPAISLTTPIKKAIVTPFSRALVLNPPVTRTLTTPVSQTLSLITPTNKALTIPVMHALLAPISQTSTVPNIQALPAPISQALTASSIQTLPVPSSQDRVPTTPEIMDVDCGLHWRWQEYLVACRQYKKFDLTRDELLYLLAYAQLNDTPGDELCLRYIKLRVAATSQQLLDWFEYFRKEVRPDKGSGSLYNCFLDLMDVFIEAGVTKLDG